MFESMLIAIDTKTKPEETIRGILSLTPSRTEKIVLLHVLDERFNGKEFHAKEKEVFDNACEALRNRGFSIEPVVMKGIPFDTIVHEAAERRVSLIVTGAGENSKWKNFLFGENVQRILELSPLPVLVSRGVPTGRSLLEHILLGVDFSNGSHLALQKIKHLTEKNPGTVRKVTMFHVHEQKNLDLLMRFVAKEQIERDIATEKERLDEMGKNLLAAGAQSFDVRMSSGRVVEEILAAVEQEAPTMLFLGAQGLGNSPLYRIGTTALRVAQMAPLSVCIVPGSVPAVEMQM